MQGGGRFIFIHRELAVGATDVTLMNLPGVGAPDRLLQHGHHLPTRRFREES